MDEPTLITPKEEEIKIIKLNEIKCFNHPNNNIVGVCIDQNCRENNKHMCVDCIFEKHSGHKIIKSNTLEDDYSKKINSILPEEKYINSELLKFMNNLRRQINNIKIKVNKILDQFYEDVLKDINNNKILKPYNELELIKNDYPPRNIEQLNKLIEILLIIYNTKENTYNNEKKIKFQQSLHIYEEIIKEKLNFLENSLNNLNFKYDHLSTWSTVTYDSHDFYYKLEENCTKVIKNSKGGTITICRGEKNLEKGKKYKLEYLINYNNGAFDAGFGDEKQGSYNWLRDKFGYGITSKGIYILGKKVKSDINLINTKKISFIIDLINYTSEIFIDEQKIYNFNINKDLIYYPMIAIRELNNSVKMKLTILNI